MADVNAIEVAQGNARIIEGESGVVNVTNYLHYAGTIAPNHSKSHTDANTQE